MTVVRHCKCCKSHGNCHSGKLKLYSTDDNNIYTGQGQPSTMDDVGATEILKDIFKYEGAMRTACIMMATGLRASELKRRPHIDDVKHLAVPVPILRLFLNTGYVFETPKITRAWFRHTNIRLNATQIKKLNYDLVDIRPTVYEDMIIRVLPTCASEKAAVIIICTMLNAGKIPVTVNTLRANDICSKIAIRLIDANAKLIHAYNQCCLLHPPIPPPNAP
jgi:hypothetical protein